MGFILHVIPTSSGLSAQVFSQSFPTHSSARNGPYVVAKSMENMLTYALKRGQQIATYRLQLPYKYSILLIILSAILHFLLSESSSVALYTDSMYQDKDVTNICNTQTLILHISRYDQRLGQLAGLPISTKRLLCLLESISNILSRTAGPSHRRHPDPLASGLVATTRPHATHWIRLAGHSGCLPCIAVSQSPAY